MAKRNILTRGNEALEQSCREVVDFNARLHTLLDDMRETMLDADGIGLAAPQVGVLRRVALVLDTNRETECPEEMLIELINPVILESEGEQTGIEGCLSVPGLAGVVTRAETVKVRAQDRDGNWFETEGTGLTARAICHELDHLDGIIYQDKATEMQEPEEDDGEEE